MNRKAYTLIELSVVIFIIGILLVSGSMMFQSLGKITEDIETDNTIDQKKKSIISFVTNGKALPDDTQVLTLGTKNTDSLGNDIQYFHDVNLEDNDSICNKNTTTLSVVRCADQTCTTPIQTISNVAFVLASDGYNIVSQTQLVSNSVKVYENDVEISGKDYDDIVDWITLNELRVKAHCNRERLFILNNELPYGYDGNTYTTTIYPKGGVPYNTDDFQWSYSFSPALTCTDTLDINNQGPTLELSCTNPSADTHLVTITVSDDDSNSYSKQFVLTIND